MDVTYPAQAIPFDAHIAILVVSFLVVIMAIVFMNKYKKPESIGANVTGRTDRNTGSSNGGVVIQ